MEFADRTEAVWFLARLMRDTMERFDPTGSPPWEELSAEDRAFYFDVMKAVLDAKSAVRAAL